MTDFKNFDKKLMTKTSKTKLKGELKYRSYRFLLSLFLISLLVVSVSASSAECLEFSNTSTSSTTGQEYVVYYQNHHSLDGCSYDVVISAIDYEEYEFYKKQFGDVQPISAEEITTSFMWGFGTYTVFWFIGFKSRAARETIKRI